jgi:hypothetical protein
VVARLPLGGEAAERREEVLHSSLVAIAELDIVTKETDFTQSGARRNALEASDEILFMMIHTKAEGKS